jgi:hypothetical protein
MFNNNKKGHITCSGKNRPAVPGVIAVFDGDAGHCPSKALVFRKK